MTSAGAPSQTPLESLQRSPDPQLYLRGPTSKGRVNEGWVKRKEEKRWGEVCFMSLRGIDAPDAVQCNNKYRYSGFQMLVYLQRTTQLLASRYHIKFDHHTTIFCSILEIHDS